MAVTFHLEHGVTYRARIAIPWFVSRATAKEKLEGRGFTGVLIYSDGGGFIAQGTWGGATQDVELPSQIKGVPWEY